MRPIDCIAGSGDSQRDDAAGQALGHAQYIRFDAGLFTGKDGPGASPARHDFVRNEQDIMFAADFRHLLQHFRTVYFHAAGAEDQRFDDQSGRRAFAVFAIGFQLVERLLFDPGFREAYRTDIKQ